MLHTATMAASRGITQNPNGPFAVRSYSHSKVIKDTYTHVFTYLVPRPASTTLLPVLFEGVHPDDLTKQALIFGMTFLVLTSTAVATTCFFN
jgi:hypothetical protein